jgi:anti-sigma factor RsiW
MADHERYVAGLWCHQVLEALPDYLDDLLPPDTRRAAEAHLAGCDWCARFGGEYAGVVKALRQRLAPPAPAPSDVARRLAERLAREL